MLTRAQKLGRTRKLAEDISKARAAFLVDFQGVNAEQITHLRKELRRNQARLQVVRNTLAKRALRDACEMAKGSKEGSDGNGAEALGVLDKSFSPLLVGPNAVVFSFGDVGVLAKTLQKASKDIKAFELKRGFLDGAELGVEQLKVLASLPGQDELRAMFLGALVAPARKFLYILQEPARAFVRVLAARRDAETKE